MAARLRRAPLRELTIDDLERYARAANENEIMTRGHRASPGWTMTHESRFEELVLKPARGHVDVASIEAWLDSRSFAFRDPVGDDGWHLSASAGAAARRRRQRLEDPARWPSGVRVGVAPDRIWIAARAHADELARALQLIEHATDGGEWTVTIDGGPPEPLGDPGRLFPAGLPTPGSLDDDVTEGPLTEGRRTRWTDHAAASPTVLVVHSSGALRYVTHERVVRGRLSEAATAAWNAAVDAIDVDDLAPLGPTSGGVQVEFEDADGLEYVRLDNTSPPPACQALVSLARAWTSAVESWRPGALIEGVDTLSASPGRD